MAIYTDPKTGFRISDTTTPEPTTADLEQALANRRAARTTPAPVVFTSIGQGIRGQPTDRLDPTRFTDHTYWTEHRTQILEAYARGEYTE